MRRATTELRRAIKLEQGLAEEYRATDLNKSLGHRCAADLLRWCVGDPGTEYERILRERNKADVAKVPAARAKAGA